MLTAARLPVPVVAVVLDQPEAVRLLPRHGDPAGVPAYAYPEAAARALARAARYGVLAIPAVRHGAGVRRRARRTRARS